jgi:hypothetical protein
MVQTTSTGFFWLFLSALVAGVGWALGNRIVGKLLG